jgi:hypothetical protein
LKARLDAEDAKKKLESQQKLMEQQVQERENTVIKAA